MTTSQQRSVSRSKMSSSAPFPACTSLASEDLKGAAATSNAALATLGNDASNGSESFVAADKTFCIYLAEDEAAIEEHALG